MSNPIHQFLTWFPIAFPTAIVTICAIWEKPKVWVANQADWILAKMSETINIAILLGICAAVFGGWLWAFLKTSPKEPQYQALAQLLAQSRLDERPNPTAPPHSALKIDSATHTHTSGVLDVVEADDTLAAKGSSGLRGLYVGWMIASAGPLRSQGYLEIAIRAFNGTGVALRIGQLTGYATGGVGNLRDLPKFPAPAMISEHAPDPIPNATEFVLILHQHVNSAIAKELLAGFESGVQLDLRHLNIEIESAEDRTRIARLPLWDGLSLKRRDDVFTGRIIMASANITLQSITAFHPATVTQDKASD